MIPERSEKLAPQKRTARAADRFGPGSHAEWQGLFPITAHGATGP